MSISYKILSQIPSHFKACNFHSYFKFTRMFIHLFYKSLSCILYVNVDYFLILPCFLLK